MGPSPAPSPCPQCSSKYPFSKPLMPAKLTAVQVVTLVAHLPAPASLDKQKQPSKEEALVSMARVFPSANPASLTNAQVAVSGKPTHLTPAEAACFRQRCFTTHGPSRHQVIVYASPSIV